MLQLKEYQRAALNKLRAYFELCNQCDDANVAFYQTTLREFGYGIPYHPVENLRGLPYVCIRIPTGGGKTLVACHAVSIAKDEVLHTDRAVVLWLVPSNTIREQTLNALRDQRHPYRQALDATLGAVAVMDVTDALYLNRATLNTATTIIVSTMQAFRREDTEGLKVYQPSGALMEHFEHVPPEILTKMETYANGSPQETLANLLCLHRPILIVDEAHNARTELSFETLARFNPSCLVEFTATPATKQNPSNVLHTVSAAELYNEEMIKLPIRLETRANWKELLSEAIRCLNHLQETARAEYRDTGDYIRPLMLIQAQARSKSRDTLTYDVLKQCLIDDFRVPEAEVAISTGSVDELEGVDLAARDCPVRFVITIQKLREGWDCPFAYVLCSLAQLKSPTAIEQIIGRVLRLPDARKKTRADLNIAYAYAASSDFAQVLGSMTGALIQNGFERQEAEDLIIQSPTKQRQLGLSYLDALFGAVTVTISEQLAAYTLPPELETKVIFNYAENTMTFRGAMSVQERAALEGYAVTPEDKAAIAQAYQESQRLSDIDYRTPAERGEPFDVPMLAIKIAAEQGSLWEQFEEQHILDHEWSLAQCTAQLSESEYAARQGAGQQAEIAVTEEGKIETRFLSHLQDQMAFRDVQAGWTEAQLVHWLDRKIPHPDIDPTDTGIFLTNLVRFLIAERDFTVDQLVYDKYRLMKAVARKIDEHRAASRHAAYQQMLFAEQAEVKVSPELCFSFPRDPLGYPYNRLYEGSYSFDKHYYPRIGAFDSTEEFDCAVFIDTLPQIRFWVRNLTRKPNYAFWLQTSTDKFYPDFVCALENDKYLVVEYKGADRWDNPENREKRALGELWAERSGGACIFVMPKGKDFATIQAQVDSAVG